MNPENLEGFAGNILLSHIEVPNTPAQKAVQALFAKASRMLLLEDNWDEAGSPPISGAAFRTAQALIHYLVEANPAVDLPVVAPGPDGTVDLHWKEPESEILVNVLNNGMFCEFFYYAESPRGIVEGATPDVDAMASTLLRHLVGDVDTPLMKLERGELQIVKAADGTYHLVPPTLLKQEL